MLKSHRYLTAAVLLSCSCLLAPFYAHAETTKIITEDSSTGFTIDSAYKEFDKVTIDSNFTNNATSGCGLEVTTSGIRNITLNAGKTIQALGDDGIAVSFIGNKEIVAMSDGAPEPVPCVDKFIVNGSLVGKKASIYIDPTTYVRDIYIQNGAFLQGNIIADKPALNYDTTMLTFGNYGVGDQEEVDCNLKISYSGDIHGEKSISMKIVGTNLEYTGEANVGSVTIAQNATLSGAGTYVLGTYVREDKTYRNSFINSGTLDLNDGKATTVVNITGNYTQYGKLLVEFNSDAESDHLQINEGGAVIQGSITLTPQVDYYFNGQTIKLNPIFSVDSDKKIDASTAILNINNISPVLNFTIAADNTKVDSQGNIVSVTEGETPDCDYGSTKYVIKVERKEQGYQNVADDKTSAGIGSAIDNELNKSKEEQLSFSQDKKDLISAIDKTLLPYDATKEDAKKVINTNLKKLNPNVVSSQAQAVVDTHTTLNNLVAVTSLANVGSMSTNIPAPRLGGGLGPAARPTPKYNSWRNIVMPFSGYTDQHNGSNGYTNHNSGVIGAIERTFANGLTHGYHAALNHQSTSDSGSTVKGEGLYLGAQASYAPADWNGWSVFGSARLGVEQMRSHRNVAILGAGGLYTGRVDSDWTGFSGSLNLGTALTKEHGVLISGPFAALDYSFVHRPGVTETGAAYRAHMDGATYDSLRTQLGYRLVTKPKPLDSYYSTQWQAHASVAWNHELLNDNGTTTYQLVEFPGTTIEDDVETYGRDSMSIAAGVIFKTPNRLDVGLTLGSDIYRKGGSSIYGKVNFEWKF